jgi:hypothetical protein
MKKLIAAVLVGLVGFSPAATYATVDQEADDHAQLLAVVEALNVPVSFDTQLCKDEPQWYGGYALDGRELVLCSRGDRAERLDTIRHEAWHVLQDLQNCSIKDEGLLQLAMGVKATPSGYKVAAAKAYQPSHVPFEAEAAWAADTFSALTISHLLYQRATECGYKFKF